MTNSTPTSVWIIDPQHVLLDQAYIAVGEETFANFCQMLDSPPEPSEGLRKLMRVKAPWA